MTTNDYNHQQHHAAIEQKKSPRDVIVDVSWAFSNFYCKNYKKKIQNPYPYMWVPYLYLYPRPKPSLDPKPSHVKRERVLY